MKNKTSRLELRRALRMSSADVAALALDKSRRAELEALQSDLLGLLAGLDAPSSEWDAVAALIVASVDNLLWYKLRSIKSSMGDAAAQDAHQIAITRVSKALSLYNPDKHPDPVAYLTTRCTFGVRSAREAARDAKVLRDELVVENDADLHSSFGSLSAGIADAGSETMLIAMEGVCSMATELNRTEKELVSSPLAYWALRNAAAESVVAEQETLCSLAE